MAGGGEVDCLDGEERRARGKYLCDDTTTREKGVSVMLLAYGTQELTGQPRPRPTCLLRVRPGTRPSLSGRRVFFSEVHALGCDGRSDEAGK